MPHSERSRSPLRQTPFSERISRQIAAFGRYPDRRPQGLHVDGNGALRLEDLMRVWGRRENLKECDVLDAVRRHMFHDSGGGGSALRFAIDTDASGRIIIRVMPKKPTSEHVAHTQPPPGREREAASRPPQGQLTVRSLHGSVLQEVAARQSATAPKAAPEALKSGFIPVKTQESPQRPEAARTSPMDVDTAPSLGEQRASVQKACEQMGLTAETRHLRQPPPASARGEAPGSHEHGRGWGRRTRRGDGRPAGERVQRWLSWALRHGHRELMVAVDTAGWARLDVIAAAMRRSRPDLGEFDAQRLQALLQETDEAGRFEISAGRLRKLGRDHRQPRLAQHVQPPTLSSSGGPERARARSCGRGRSASRSSSSVHSIHPGRPRSLSPPPVATSGESMPHPFSEKEKGKPPPPPGDHWTKYQDHGRDWFFYEGPLGRWWCESAADEIQPFDEE
mmetsp:Transcript_126608/g.369961  ORF Transcript_126608/g.369961 Transcript_126608/m.369961 type:complete len:451 (+) Transcript_126608:98-1450(+)